MLIRLLIYRYTRTVMKLALKIISKRCCCICSLFSTKAAETKNPNKLLKAFFSHLNDFNNIICCNYQEMECFDDLGGKLCNLSS